MKGYRWYFLLIVPFLISIVLLSTIYRARVSTTSGTANAMAATSDADSAMTAYVNTFYDANAKYFYADTTHAGYNSFWTEAQSWDIVMDAYQRTHSATYRQMIDDVYNGFMARNSDMSTACNTSNNFTLSNNYNDDIGWWAKASIRAYQITGESRYENCAKRLFDSIYGYWNTSTLGGGIWWTRNDPTQKNVATNAPAAITAVNLSIALSDSSYLTKAKTIYNWIKTTLTNQSGTVYDDYRSGSLVNVPISYNYGTFIGAAVALYQATGTSSYLTDATAAAKVSLTKITSNGILRDEGTGDNGGFKGIYVRYLAQYANVAHSTQYTTFLQDNANTAWSNRRSDDLIGTNWSVPTPSGNIESHTFGSAVALLQDASLQDTSLHNTPAPGAPVQSTPAPSTPVQSTPVPSTPANGSITLQAEDGRLHSLSTESSSTGYYGTGYIAGWHQDGQWVDLTPNVTTAGSYNLTMRFATGAGAAARYLYVNGAGVINKLAFPSTGSWRSYATETVNNVYLHAGSNTISLIYNSSLGSSNYLNLDEVIISQ